MTKTIALLGILAITAAGCKPSTPPRPLTPDQFRSAVDAYLDESRATARYLAGNPTSDGTLAQRTRLVDAYDRMQLPDVPPPYDQGSPTLRELLKNMQRESLPVVGGIHDYLAEGNRLDPQRKGMLTTTCAIWLATCDSLEEATERLRKGEPAPKPVEPKAVDDATPKAKPKKKK